MIHVNQEANQRLEDLTNIARRQFEEKKEVKEEASEEQRQVTKYITEAEGDMRT